MAAGTQGFIVSEIGIGPHSVPVERYFSHLHASTPNDHPGIEHGHRLHDHSNTFIAILEANAERIAAEGLALSEGDFLPMPMKTASMAEAGWFALCPRGR